MWPDRLRNCIRAELMTMRGQPRRHLRSAPELIQVLVSGEECILNRILRVGCIAQFSKGHSLK